MWYQSPLIGPMGQGPPELQSIVAAQFLVPPVFSPTRMAVLDDGSPQPTGIYNGFSLFSHSYTPHFPPPQYYPPPPSPILQFPQFHTQMTTMADSSHSVSQIHSPTPHTYNQSYPSHPLPHQFTPRHSISPIYPSNSPERFSQPSVHFVPSKTTITPSIHQPVSISQHHPPLRYMKLEEPTNSRTPSLTEMRLEPNFIGNNSPKWKLKSARVKDKFKVMSRITMKRERRLGFSRQKQFQLSPILNSLLELSVHGQHSEPEISLASPPCVEACFQLEEQEDNGLVDDKVVGLPPGYGQLHKLGNVNSEFNACKLFDKRSQLEGLYTERMIADAVIDWLLSKYEPDNAWLEFLRRKLKAIESVFHLLDCTSVFLQDIDAFAPYGPRHIEFNSCDPIDDYLKQYLLKHDVNIFQNMTITGFRSGKEPKCKEFQLTLKMFFDGWKSTFVSHSIEEVTLFNSLIKSWSLKVLKSEYQSLSVQKSRFSQDYKTENERAIVGFGVIETLPSFNEDGVLSLYGFSVWSLELLYKSRNMGKEVVTQLFVGAIVPCILWGPNKVNISTPREILIEFLDMIQPSISSKLVAFQNILVCFQVNWYDPQYWKKCGYISLDLVASKTPIELRVPNLVLEVILSKNMTLQLVWKTIIGILGKPTLFYVSSLALDLVINNYGREWYNMLILRWVTWLLKIMKKNLAMQKLIWPFERIITCWHEGIISAPESRWLLLLLCC